MTMASFGFEWALGSAGDSSGLLSGLGASAMGLGRSFAAGPLGFWAREGTCLSPFGRASGRVAARAASRPGSGVEGSRFQPGLGSWDSSGRAELGLSSACNCGAEAGERRAASSGSRMCCRRSGAWNRPTVQRNRIIAARSIQKEEEREDGLFRSRFIMLASRWGGRLEE